MKLYLCVQDRQMPTVGAQAGTEIQTVRFDEREAVEWMGMLPGIRRVFEVEARELPNDVHWRRRAG